MNYDVSFPYEDVYNRYIVQNCSGEELMAHYNISKSTFFKILRYYGIKKDTKLANENRVKTVIAKYGAYLSNGFVRVYDDGYDLIKE